MKKSNNQLSGHLGKKPFGLIARPDSREAILCAKKISQWLEKKKLPVVYAQITAHLLGRSDGLPLDRFSELADPIVTLGGDGTLLSTARYINRAGPLLIGVNFGQLGFLTEITPLEIFDVLADLLRGKGSVRERAMISARIVRQNRTAFFSQAANDIVIQKRVEDRLLELDVYINNDNLMRLRADGLIIATPSGSTAYSLAAGGSIIEPSQNVQIITAICPHSLTNRPVVVGLNDEITVKIPKFSGVVSVTADGQHSDQIESHDQIIIKKSSNKLKLLASPSRSYFEILRTKLNWAAPNRNV
ncbi:MAG TPA: NAD(+)/NADH kinase [Oligoflexia bacterium]|nr:NAD(+)/NADH kinase [Oligoflexia bacterium]HMP26366.1 NAD(+)/NADH kinase [Oligoflexia bacterium]